jgi:hypothetical protein
VRQVERIRPVLRRWGRVSGKRPQAHTHNYAELFRPLPTKKKAP